MHILSGASAFEHGRPKAGHDGATLLNVEDDDRGVVATELAGAFDRLFRLLQEHAERSRPDAVAVTPQHVAGPVAPATVTRLCTRFGLTRFEGDVLTLCAGIELDGRFNPACASANGSAAMPFVTFGLTLNALPDAQWRAISASAPLRYWRLIDVGAGPSLVESPLRIDDTVLQWVLGEAALDSRIADLVFAIDERTLSDSQQNVVGEIVATWLGAQDPPFFQLIGGEPATARAVAAAACAFVGVPVRGISFSALVARGADGDRDMRLIARQLLLEDGAVLIDEGDVIALEPNARALLERLIERIRGPVFLAAREPLSGRPQPSASFTIRKPTSREQRTLWVAQVGATYGDLAGKLATQFDFDAPRIELAAQLAAAATLASAEPAAKFVSAVWSSARRVSRVRLDGLAQLIEPRATWDALVLPEAARTTLDLIVNAVEQRATVYDAWGFGALDARGLGITALFAGPSGTGKTLAAEVIAHRLAVDLYRVDLSAIVSKYIGETEKNLRSIFEAAEAGGAILLFDEADALFGKRSEVKDSHDRHANVEISYLLQRMETYRGVAILTTNVKDALDRAFLRRIRFVVSFPFPDSEHREAIWRGVFPAGTPLHELDFRRLAQLDVTGGNIRNIALNAAFLAAAGNGPVTMAHLLEAARIEYAKIEKTLAPSETARWIPDRTMQAVAGGASTVASTRTLPT